MALHPVKEKKVYNMVLFAYYATKMMKSLEITICPMTTADIDAILVIEEASFPHPWNRTHFIQELQAPYSFPLVALGPHGDVIGYVCPMLLLNEGHILDIATKPEVRGQGVGRMLVERVLMDCEAGGAEYVSLEVRPSNVQAISLYKSFGFSEAGRRRRYYQDGEDALVMEYIFSSEERGNAV